MATTGTLETNDDEASRATRAAAGQEDELRLQAKERVANTLSFAKLCKRLERASHEVRQRGRKLEVLFPRQLRIALHGQSPYPLFRLLLPHIDNARGNYHIKQVNLARFYVEVLGLDARFSTDAQKLLRYRQPPPPRTLYSAKKRTVTYDWPEVLEDVLSGRVPREPSNLTLAQVNAVLDRLAGAGGNAQRRAVLEEVSVTMSAVEQKWLARIILADLKIGMKEDMILGFFHERASYLYDATVDLRYVCAALSEGGRVIDRASTNIKLNRPFTPMLAAAIHHQLHTVEPAMRGHAFAVENKIDGERMLCHKAGDQVSWYTRSATNYTGSYGPHLTPWVLRCVSVQDCILDGEVVGWDRERQAFLHFKENRSIVADLPPPSFSPSEEGEHDNPQSRVLVFVVFDVVYINGPNAQALLEDCASDMAGVDASELRPGSITHLPLRARRAVLERIVTPEYRKLELVRQERVEDADTGVRLERLMTAFDGALQARVNMEEGLVVKSLESAYVLGEKSRGLQYWVKMKPEYSDLTTNLDVIVLGAYYSEGKRRSGRLASLLIGIAEPPADATRAAKAPGGTRASAAEEEEEDDEDELLIPWSRPPETPKGPEPSGASTAAAASTVKPEPLEEPSRLKPKWFYTLGRCGGGVSFEEWEELEKRLPFKPWPKGKHCPKHFKPWKPTRHDVPDFYIEPKDSVVLEVKCMAIVESESFSSGYTLRFPRNEAIRYDKHWSSCLSLPELQAIAEGPARGGALEAMQRTHGKPLLSKRSQRKSQAHTQNQLQSQLLVEDKDPFPQRKDEGGAGPLLAPRATASHRPPPPVRVVGTYRTVDEGSVERKDELLQRLEFCVMGDFDLGEVSADEETAYSSSGGGSDTSKKSAAAASVPSMSSVGDHRLLSKTDVEKMILEHGGRLTGSPRAGETALILAPDAKSFRVKLLIRSGKFDVVGLPYLLRCIREGKLTRPRYLDYLFMTKETRAWLKRVVDEYGDAYASYTTPQALARCLRHIKPPAGAGAGAGATAASSASAPMQQRDVGRLPWRTVAMASLRAKEDHQLLFEGSRFNFLYTFGRHVIYLDRFPDLGPMQLSPGAEPAARTSLPVTRLDHLTASIPLHGGVVSDALHTGVTHVIVHRVESARFPLLAARLKALRRLPVAQVEKRVVGSEWVEECLAAKKVVPVEKRHLVAMH